MSDWFKDWFASEEYLEVYSHRNKTDAYNLLNLIKENINLYNNAKVLDAACGSGRFSNLFAKHGFNVTAFDLSTQLLQIAKRKAVEENLKVNYFRADIRKLPLRGSFDLVLNMFTSFGYFDTDDENFSFISTAYNLLNKKGIFIFDYLNKNYVINNLVKKSKKSINNKTIIEFRKINGNRVEKEIIINTGKEEKKFNESVMMYSKEQIIDGFNNCGFKVYKIFGNYSGEMYKDYDSDRLLIFFTK